MYADWLSIRLSVFTYKNTENGKGRFLYVYLLHFCGYLPLVVNVRYFRGMSFCNTNE